MMKIAYLFFNIPGVLILLLFFSSLRAQESYTVVFLNRQAVNSRDTTVMQHAQEPLTTVKRLAEGGKLLMAGFFSGGNAVFIMNTPSVREATDWLATDPGVNASLWETEILPFTFRTGGICKVADTLGRVAYQFIRFVPRITKYNVKNAATTLLAHDSYMSRLNETGNVAAEGTLGEAGNILILRGDVDEEVFEQSPGVEATVLNFEHRELWVLPGSLCEKRLKE